ncbi:MAG TPA: hypothetical protein VGR51_08425 [Thermoplasmata archaeon]|jgi:hypothetical protein|nr:hypothetical protein [Thermoplasmata archaeon]
MDRFPPDAAEYAKEVELPPRKQRGWVHEVEVPMREGENLEYATAHDGEGDRVAFNIHSHEGGETSYYVQSSKARTAGSFSSPSDGNFYLMWENVSGAPVRVQVRATRR